jgi:hypothetical protein
MKTRNIRRRIIFKGTIDIIVVQRYNYLILIRYDSFDWLILIRYDSFDWLISVLSYFFSSFKWFPKVINRVGYYCLFIIV